jgi:UDP-glucose 4-epimerase
MGNNRESDTARVTPIRASEWMRDDLVIRKGQLTLINSTLTPRDAMIADTLFVRDALEAAGIAMHLVRGNDERPVIAVDITSRPAVEAALVAATADEPFSAKPHSSSSGAKRAKTIAAGALADSPKTRSFALYRPRVEPLGRLRYGASNGVLLQFWSFGEHTVVAPTESALTRRSIPVGELHETSVERFGATWPTFEGMFDALASDIDFDIDLVFSWVDGTDLEFQRARAAQMQSYVVGEGDDHPARFRQLDELRYALRSVHLFAPWVRRIFIVTDSPRPLWLADDPRVTIVRSEEFFADVSVLPTHNSQAVESQLHRIPGIAEHFLYSNDDMFFGKPVSPGMFFTPGGISKFVEASTRIGLGEPTAERSGFENAARVNRALLRERFGITITRHLEHCAAPLRTSVLEELEREFPGDFTRTGASAFRARTDISVTNSLYHYYALRTGRAVVQETVSVKYVDTTTRVGLDDMHALLKKRSFDMFCLNDGSFPEISTEERAHAVRSFLDRYFAIEAPWEVSEADLMQTEHAV